MAAIETENAGGVRRIYFNRPERRNSIRPSDLHALIAALEDADGDPNVRCVVLGGRGGWFSAGGDMAEGIATDTAGARQLVKGYQRAVTLILEHRAPVVVVLEGVVVGAAASFVLAADISIADPRSRILFPTVHRGFVPDAGSVLFLARALGPARTKALLLSGGEFGAPAARDLGLITDVADDPWATADEWVDRLVAGPPHAIRLTRELISQALYPDLATSLRLEAAAMGSVFGTSEPAEGMAAFTEKREPNFRS